MARVPCRSPHRDHCLFVIFVSRVAIPQCVDWNKICHTQELVKVLDGNALAQVSRTANSKVSTTSVHDLLMSLGNFEAHLRGDCRHLVHLLKCLRRRPCYRGNNSSWVIGKSRRTGPYTLGSCLSRGAMLDC